MLGVPRELVEHALNVDPKARLVKQPLQRFDKPKRKAIAADLHRLENAGFIKEIKTSSWVSNQSLFQTKSQMFVASVLTTQPSISTVLRIPSHYPG
jgi:hypothetical protein